MDANGLYFSYSGKLSARNGFYRRRAGDNLVWNNHIMHITSAPPILYFGPPVALISSFENHAEYNNKDR